MELYVQLILTLFVSLIFTSFFIKLVSMQPINQCQIQDSNPCLHLRTLESAGSAYAINTNHNMMIKESVINTNKFEAMPYTDEVIKLQECPFEGKSSVEIELFNVKADDHIKNKFKDIVIDDSNTETEFDDQELLENGEERKLCEIEIESMEEEQEEDKEGIENEMMIMDDWEEIGRKDYEELIGNKARLYYLEVEFDGK